MFILQGYAYLVNLLTGLGLLCMCPGSRSDVHIAVTWGERLKTNDQMKQRSARFPGVSWCKEALKLQVVSDICTPNPRRCVFHLVGGWWFRWLYPTRPEVTWPCLPSQLRLSPSPSSYTVVWQTFVKDKTVNSFDDHTVSVTLVNVAIVNKWVCQ